MAIALYMDENVPRQILLGLRLRGVDVPIKFYKKRLALLASFMQHNKLRV